MQVLVPLIRRLEPDDSGRLTKFFRDICDSDVVKYFHPHPFDGSAAITICESGGGDYYCAAFNGKEICGYGMLRGYAEGYVVPSLGIAIHPEYQGREIGSAVMLHLHGVAVERGASQIRLRVHPDNKAALRLYLKKGYVFTGELDRSELVGIVDLLCLR